MSFFHPTSLGLSRGHFYFAQSGHYHFACHSYLVVYLGSSPRGRPLGIAFIVARDSSFELRSRKFFSNESFNHGSPVLFILKLDRLFEEPEFLPTVINTGV